MNKMTCKNLIVGIVCVYSLIVNVSFATEIVLSSASNNSGVEHHGGNRAGSKPWTVVWAQGVGPTYPEGTKFKFRITNDGIKCLWVKKVNEGWGRPIEATDYQSTENTNRYSESGDMAVATFHFNGHKANFAFMFSGHGRDIFSFDIFHVEEDVPGEPQSIGDSFELLGAHGKGGGVGG